MPVAINAQDRVIDFHALRHTFITMVGKSGVSAREHMDLARHSSYAMTARYSHAQFYDLAAAVRSLPLPTACPSTEAPPLAATGTDGRSKNLGSSLGPQPAKTGDFQRQTEAHGNGPSPTKNPGKPAVSGIFRGTDNGLSKVEAAGVEPASRGISAPASTCVVRHFWPSETCASGARSSVAAPTNRVCRGLTEREV